MSGTAPKLALLAACIALAGCGGSTAELDARAPVALDAVSPERLLDAGINRFSGEVSEEDEAEGRAFPQVRRSEALYFPQLLRTAMLRSGGWRHVWYVPERAMPDLEIDGEILRSDGAELQLRIRAADATGDAWLDHIYTQEFTEFLHERDPPQHPADELFDRIAEDLLRARNARGDAGLKEIRSVTEMRFAREFLPQAFGAYLARDGHRTRLAALPAQDDPLYQLTQQLKEKDDLFLQRTQEHVEDFVVKFDPLYRDWARNSHLELEERSSLASSALLKGVLGVLVLAGGIAAAAEGGSAETRELGQLAAIGGGLAAYSAYDDYQSLEIHDEALKELGRSLDQEMADSVIKVENQTHTLTGSVEQQYRQWHNILTDYYQAEYGARP